ncbi:2'-5' RNA ligase family protein [Roseofilum capinflatum]|uniref:2'-5' RNA ligase family protein n=1 Tax=Roseofilum capinflatum BLCC-M114 TaxID=3022440 RepID=A0ABT7B206_9CYAN|nr:2'-5' RNA ligase family protein [Roseofilum capinflatum]MDJ1173202.1 2'-5' RNA ligase family protein [Roseofilum capinflatum BLCC-M114]
MNRTIQRFFVALVVPSGLQEQVEQIKQEFGDRYQSRKAFNAPAHITLQPPFEWEPDNIQQVEESLAEFVGYHSPIPIQLDGFAAFPPRVIYVHVVKTPELMALQPALIEHLQTTLPEIQRPHHRAFTPHVTVAFRDLTPKNFRLAWPQFEHRPFQGTFTASSLTLLHHNGQRWQSCAEFPFTAKL